MQRLLLIACDCSLSLHAGPRQVFLLVTTVNFPFLTIENCTLG